MKSATLITLVAGVTAEAQAALDVAVSSADFVTVGTEDVNVRGFSTFQTVPVVASLSACEDLCKANSDCANGYFIYNSPAGTVGRKGQCWLAEARKPDGEGHTCNLDANSPDFAPCVSFENQHHVNIARGFNMLTSNNDYNADVLANGFQGAPTADLKGCMTQCKDNELCEVGMYIASSQQCWLSHTKSDHGVPCTGANGECQSFEKKPVTYREYGAQHWVCGGTYGSSTVADKAACTAKCTAAGSSCAGITFESTTNHCELVEDLAIAQLKTMKTVYHAANGHSGLDSCVTHAEYCPYGQDNCDPQALVRDIELKEEVSKPWAEADGAAGTLFPYHSYKCGREEVAGTFDTPIACRAECDPTKCGAVEYNQVTKKCYTVDLNTMKAAGRFQARCVEFDNDVNMWYDTKALGPAGNFYHHLAMQVKTATKWDFDDATCAAYQSGATTAKTIDDCRDECELNSDCAAIDWRVGQCKKISMTKVNADGFPDSCQIDLFNATAPNPSSDAIWFKPRLACPANFYHMQFVNNYNLLEPLRTGFRTCHACPTGSTSIVGSRTCQNGQEETCSHTACKLHLNGHSTCRKHTMANPTDHLSFVTANNTLDMETYGKMCNDRTDVGEHIVVYHHGSEAKGMNHKCTYDKNSATCSCLCK
jgi:hypothetical protein